MPEDYSAAIIRLGMDLKNFEGGTARMLEINAAAAAQLKKMGASDLEFQSATISQKLKLAEMYESKQVELHAAALEAKATADKLFMEQQAARYAEKDEIAAIGAGSIPAGMATGTVAGVASSGAGVDEGAAAGGMMKGLGGLAAAAATVAVIEGVLSKVRKFSNVAEITGQSFERIQRLDYAFKMTGIDVDQGNKNLEKLNQLVGEARMGGDEAQKKFAKWGINIDGKNNAEIFAEVADKIKSMSNPAERSALAFDLMGKSGRELIPLLKEGADAIDRMGKHAPIFSNEDKENILTAKESVDKIYNWFLIMAGKGFANIGQTSRLLGIMSTGKGYGAAADELNRTGNAEANAEIDATHSPVAAAAAAKKITEEADRKHAESVRKGYVDEETGQNRVIALVIQHKTLLDQIEGLKKTGLDTSEKAEQYADLQNQADQLDLQIIKDQRDVAKEKKDITEEIQNLENEKGRAHRAEGQIDVGDAIPKLEDLAAGGGWLTRQKKRHARNMMTGKSPFSKDARDAIWWKDAEEEDIRLGNAKFTKEFDDKGNLIGTNLTGGQAFIDMGNRLKAENNLWAAGLETPEMKKSKMEENIGKIEDNIKKLYDKAGGDGINIGKIADQ